MAHYASLDRIKADIPAADIVRMLDDDGDGNADPAASEAVLAETDIEVNALLAGRFATPLPEPFPAVVCDAADDLLIVRLLKRRRIFAGPKSQAGKDAADARARLQSLGEGKGTLDVNGPPPTRPAGSAITEPSRTHSSGGFLSA